MPCTPGLRPAGGTLVVVHFVGNKSVRPANPEWTIAIVVQPHLRTPCKFRTGECKNSACQYGHSTELMRARWRQEFKALKRNPFSDHPVQGGRAAGGTGDTALLCGTDHCLSHPPFFWRPLCNSTLHPKRKVSPESSHCALAIAPSTLFAKLKFECLLPKVCFVFNSPL